MKFYSELYLYVSDDGVEPDDYSENAIEQLLQNAQK